MLFELSSVYSVLHFAVMQSPNTFLWGFYKHIPVDWMALVQFIYLCTKSYGKVDNTKCHTVFLKQKNLLLHVLKFELVSGLSGIRNI